MSDKSGKNESGSGEENYNISDIEHGFITSIQMGNFRDENPDPEFLNYVNDYLTEGWVIPITHTVEKEKVVIRKSGKQSLVGHLIIAILTFWTLGIGNIVYWYFRKYRRGEKKVLRPSQMEAQSGKEPKSYSETTPKEEDPLEKVEELRDLRDSGTITEEEFKEKKDELLDRV